MEYFELSNGVKIPALGIGTFLLAPDAAEKAVTAALADGYSLVDTANAYVNEKAVGRALKNSGTDRKDVFLSTKLWRRSIPRRTPWTRLWTDCRRITWICCSYISRQAITSPDTDSSKRLIKRVRHGR